MGDSLVKGLLVTEAGNGVGLIILVFLAGTAGYRDSFTGERDGVTDTLVFEIDVGSLSRLLDLESGLLVATADLGREIKDGWE